MGIQATNAALLTQRRREHIEGESYDPTADEAKPNERDRWAVYTLLRKGEIERQHRDAAEWLWGLIEQSQQTATGWITEAMGIAASPHQKHYTMLRRCEAMRASEGAFQAVTIQGYGRIARTLFEPVSAHGRPTVAQCAHALDMEPNGCRRRIRECLEALSDYRDRTDADRAAHKARVTGIDTTHFSEHKFVTI